MWLFALHPASVWSRQILSATTMSSNGIPTASPSTQASDQLPTQPGQTLNNGRYEVHRKLGSGIYSTTWLVSDTHSE